MKPGGMKIFFHTQLRARGLSAQFDRQRVVIGARAETIDQNMIQRFHVWQLPQESDHVRGGAHISKLAQQPGHRQENPHALKVLLFEFIDLVIRMVTIATARVLPAIPSSSSLD